jgi:hypothetical protein
MAPEQVAHPAEVDHRADIYALGVVFYQMLTGELPASHLEPPSRKVHLDVRLDEVVLRALEERPERRYQQVSEIKTALETISATSPTAEPVGATSGRRIHWLPALVLYAIQAALVLPLELSLLHADWDRFWLWVIVVTAALIPAYAAWGRLHYRCWKMLPEKFRATTPAQAVGFLFIPFFNFYWLFISFPKLADGFNALRQQRQDLPIRDLKSLGIAKAILFVCVWTVGFIPGLNTITNLADLLVFFLFYRGIVANANLLAIGPQAPETPAQPREQGSQLKTAVPSAKPENAAAVQGSRSRPAVVFGAVLFFAALLIVGIIYWAINRPSKVDLLRRYPTGLTSGDPAESNARSWQFSEADIFRLSRFSLQVGNALRVEMDRLIWGSGTAPMACCGHY